MEYVDRERLAQVLETGAAEFVSAPPFPHVVIDGFLQPDVAAALEHAFPRPDDRVWTHHRHPNSDKFACNRREALPPLFGAVLDELNSPPVLDFLERVTHIPALVPDADLEGGGLHQIVRSGFLNVHADFNYHPTTGYHRRLNLLLYLNRDWPPEWNGGLELWDRAMARCVRRIEPALNRCVIFATTDSSFHGHPRPLACPETASRKSLAVYYYTVERPAAETSDRHGTKYRLTPADTRPA